MPYSRLLAAFMLATLISTIFALPASAAGTLTVSTAPVATAVAGSSVDYVTTITEPNVGPVLGVVFTDTIDVGTITAIVPSAGLTCTVDTSTSASCASYDFAHNEIVTVTVTVTAPAAGTINNTATATATTPPDTDQDIQATTVTPLADLTIAKNHSAGVLTPGSDVTYNLVITNAGPSTATTVQAHDTLDASLTFKSSTSCTAVLQVVTCTVPDVAPGTPQTVSFVATISASASTATAIANTATVTTGTSESNAGNNTSNSDTFTPTANPVDLGVTIDVLPTSATLGGTVTYTVVVSNLSTVADATNVVVSDAVPTGLITAQPPTAPPPGTTAAVAGNTWTWTIPTLAKASSSTTPTTMTASFDAVVDPATTLTTITNSVSVLAAETDPVTSNNTDSVDLTIGEGEADLNVNSAVSDSKVNQGDLIDITISVANLGPDDATNVVVKNVLPTGLKQISCTGCDGTTAPLSQAAQKRQSSQTITLGTIANGTTATAVLTVAVVASGGVLQNRTSILSVDQGDPNGVNDTSTFQITVGATSGNPGGSTGSNGGTGGTGNTGGTTAFTGFTAGQLMPWFMLLFSLGLVAVEWSRRMRLVSPIGSTYGFDPFQG